MEDKDINIKKDDLNIFEKATKKRIIFAKLNKHYLLPFLTPIFCLIGTYLLSRISNSKIKRTEFLEFLLMELSFINAGVISFIFEYKSK